jgi:AcrR family transcriptional regulator
VSRDAARSREAIFDAAEQLFAARGFRAVTLEQIGAEAKLSRGTPGYFFGSKQALYRAVLARVQDARDEAVGEAFAPLHAWADNPKRRRAGLRSALEAALDGYWQFLRERPSFARLIAWESLDGRGRIGGATDSGAIADALRVVHVRRAELGLRDFDPVLVSIAFVSLCFLPSAHAVTFARMSDVKTDSPRFWERYRAQILDSLMHSLI